MSGMNLAIYCKVLLKRLKPDLSDKAVDRKHGTVYSTKPLKTFQQLSPLAALGL